MPMRVVKVEGDGDCLFHALAYFESGDGGALRIEVADFLEANALEQQGFEETWFREAEKLRASAWGGHTAIVAYSLMKKTRVILHTHKTGAAETTVVEQSHSPVIDCNEVLYNGVNRYDALVPLVTAADREGLMPAWENQPSPDAYLSKPTSKRVAQDSLEAESGKPPKRRRFNVLRPNPVAPKKPCKEPKPPASGKKNKPKKDKHEMPTPVTRHRRYTCKTTPPPELRDDILTEMAKVPVTATGTLHPQRKIEDMIKAGTPSSVKCVLRATFACGFLPPSNTILSVNPAFYPYARSSLLGSCGAIPPCHQKRNSQMQTPGDSGPKPSAPSLDALGFHRKEMKKLYTNTSSKNTPWTWNPSVRRCYSWLAPHRTPS